MTKNLNLALDFVEFADPAPSGGPRGAVARVYVSLACCYLKDGGAPTISADCASFVEFEKEVNRLKAECDEILRDAKGRFPGSRQPAARPAPAQSEADRPSPARETVVSRAKTPVRLEQSLRVEDRMTRDVRTLHPNDKLSIADELMKIGSFRHVVVVAEDDQ